jgi:hypothetical protein
VNPDMRTVSWYCALHGSQQVQCCERASLAYNLRVIDRLGSVPWARRSEVRHSLQELHSECLELRADMAREELSRPGSVEQIDSMIAKLEHCKRMLSNSYTLRRL